MAAPVQYSIVIPVYNGGARFKDCLARLVELDYARERFEVIVVDNGSEDGTLNLSSVFAGRVRFLEERLTRSPYTCRNLGARKAGGEWLLFLDADCLAGRDLLNRYDDELKVRSCAALAGGIRFSYEDPRNPCEIYDSGRWLKQERSVRQGFGLTANLLVRRDIFFKAGGFPEGIASGGDRFFGRRLRDLGVELGYAPQALVFHPARTSIEALVEKGYRVGKGFREAEYYWRHPLNSVGVPSAPSFFPRFRRIWRMLLETPTEFSGCPLSSLALYWKLLWIDWQVNAAIRSGYEGKVKIVNGAEA